MTALWQDIQPSVGGSLFPRGAARARTYRGRFPHGVSPFVDASFQKLTPAIAETPADAISVDMGTSMAEAKLRFRCRFRHRLSKVLLRSVWRPL